MPRTKSAGKAKAKYPPPISPARWAKMTPRQRLLGIAKDVLAQLASRKEWKLRPERMVYVGADILSLVGLSAEEVRARLLAGFDCSACAVGAMWISRARIANDLDAHGLYRNYENVSSEVGLEERDKIESAFECVPMGWSDVDVHPAVVFGNRYSDSTDRLKAIMKNIVAHAGVFKPDVPARKPKAAR